MKGISKFDFSTFHGSVDEFAVSRQRYTKEQAIEVFKTEMMIKEEANISIGEAYVRYRYGVSEDGEKLSSWWLEYDIQTPRSCPVWTFHYTRNKNLWYEEQYEHTTINKKGEIK